MMKVAIILGSVREGRQTLKAARYVQGRLNRRNIHTEWIDLAEEPLPILGSPENQKPELDERIQSVGQRIQSSDAVILATPEYQGSFSGVLKNALDHFYPEFDQKPIGVVAASAGRMAGINASTQLQHVILSLGAYPLPRKLLVPQIQDTFNDSFNPSSRKMADSTDAFLNDFVWFTEALTEKKKKDLNLSNSYS